MENTIRILIVDDDPDVIDEILQCIESIDNTLQPVALDDPQKALDLLKGEILFDLIFCDYNFYGSTITGLEIFGEIKKIYQERVCVGVLITGWGTTELFTREQAAGLFSDFIEKPFSAFDNLKVKINNAIALLARRREAEDRLKAAIAEPGV